MKKLTLAILLLSFLCMSSCSAIEGIFKAGAVAGIIAVVIVIAIIIWIVSLFRGKS